MAIAIDNDRLGGSCALLRVFHKRFSSLSGRRRYQTSRGPRGVLRVGDEVTIRIIEADETDPPKLLPVQDPTD